MSSIAVSCVFGAKRDMSAALPKHQTLRCSQTCRPAGLSVCCAMTSQPRLTSVWTAAASLAGSNHEFDHDELGGDLRILRLRGEREGVHAEHHFRHLVGAEIADHVRLRHHSGDRALDRAALMEARIVGAEIVGVLVAGAMLEHHVRELLGDFDRLVHVAEGRREDELVALLREILQDRCRARVLLDVLDIVGDDLALEGVDHRLAALLMRPGPAVVADRPEIDEADLERFGGARACAKAQAPPARRRRPSRNRDV